MYYAIVISLMGVLPALSIAFEASLVHSSVGWPLIGKWFVFWAGGVRLLLAGLRQVAQPAYTAKHLLGVEGSDVHLVVRELGYANIAFGTVGIFSLRAPGWTGAAALAGGIFYGLAGVNHVLQRQRNRLQNTAMVSDLFAAVVLLGYCLWRLG